MQIQISSDTFIRMIFLPMNILLAGLFGYLARGGNDLGAIMFLCANLAAIAINLPLAIGDVRNWIFNRQAPYFPAPSSDVGVVRS